MKTKKWIWIIGVGLAILIISQMKKEALLPAGQYNVDADCTWATNVNPIDSSWSSYEDSGAWIAMDKNQDGSWEKYGYKNTVISTQSKLVIVADINSHGDDIVSTTILDPELQVQNANNRAVYEKDYGAAANAIIHSCVLSYSQFVNEVNNFMGGSITLSTFITNANMWVSS
jgi:hypothetical protein